MIQSLAAYRLPIPGLARWHESDGANVKASNPIRTIGRAFVEAMPHTIGAALRDAKRAILNTRGSAAVFHDIYAHNGWDGTESASGPGSTMAATENIRAALPVLISELNITTLLDLPCGDGHWISTCLPPDVQYIGGDVVAEIIERNRRVRPGLGTFQVIDLVTDPLPSADLILVRDCFIHLPNKLVLQAINNIKCADIKFLLTTTFPNEVANQDIELGGYRAVNLIAAPFELPEPKRLILDEDGVRNNGKHLGLWKLC